MKVIVYSLYALAGAAVFATKPTARKFLAPPAKIGLWVAVFLAAAAVSLVVTDAPWWGDFESAYYPGGSLIISNPAALYDEECLEGFVNLPLVAVLFIPFAALPYGTSIGVFTAIGAIAIFAALALMLRNFGQSAGDRFWILALFALNGPLLYSVREGNTTHMVLLALVAALVLLERKRYVAAAAILGVATVIKLPLAMFGLFFLIRREWRGLAAYIGTGAAAIGISLASYGVAPHEAWVQQCIVRYMGKPIPGFIVQSADGFLARLLGADMVWFSPQDVGPGFVLTKCVIVGALAAMAGLLVWIRRRKTGQADLYTEFSAALLLAVLIFPISWAHYYLFLLIPLVLIATGRIMVSRERTWMLLLAASAVAVSLPLRKLSFANPWVDLIGSRIASSHYFLGGVGLLIALAYGAAKTEANRPSPSATGSRSVV